MVFSGVTRRGSLNTIAEGVSRCKRGDIDDSLRALRPEVVT